MRRALTSARPVRLFVMPLAGLSMLIRISASVVSTASACPYRVRFIHPVTKTADKCDFCRKTNLQAGKLPACVEACPTKALTFGNLDDPNSEISQLLRQKPTYRYKLALGTKPKLYRVPFKYGEVSQ